MIFWLQKLFCDLTDGVELGIEDPRVQIAHTTCDYCGSNLIGVWDDHIKSTKGLPYQGNQARYPKAYPYAYKGSTIAAIKAHYHLGENDWFTEENNLLNVCGKVHVLSFVDGEWKLRTDLACQEPGSTRVLCNGCFKNANAARVAIMGSDGLMYSVSVMADKGETIEENDGKVTVKLWGTDKPLEIEGTIIGAHIAPFGIALGGWKISATGKITGVPDLKWDAEKRLYSYSYAVTFGLSGKTCQYEAYARVTENMNEFKEAFKQHCEEKDYIILRKEAVSAQMLKELESLK
ncbi:MAG: hypothetical protein IIV98_00485 [Aeriscardovia sp.]|nr:hypothetical protein [Aeriscardovia sp.]